MEHSHVGVGSVRLSTFAAAGVVLVAIVAGPLAIDRAGLGNSASSALGSKSADAVIASGPPADGFVHRSAARAPDAPVDEFAAPASAATAAPPSTMAVDVTAPTVTVSLAGAPAVAGGEWHASVVGVVDSDPGDQVRFIVRSVSASVVGEVVADRLVTTTVGPGGSIQIPGPWVPALGPDAVVRVEFHPDAHRPVGGGYGGLDGEPLVVAAPGSEDATEVLGVSQERAGLLERPG